MELAPPPSLGSGRWMRGWAVGEEVGGGVKEYMAFAWSWNDHAGSVTRSVASFLRAMTTAGIPDAYNVGTRQRADILLSVQS